jgi:serine/threonine protein kinase
MDYSAHGNLIDYLRRCKIPLDERRELALDIASALKVLHDCKIVHGDVKPQNVLIYDNNDYEGMDIIRPQVARLADFGGSIAEQDFAFLPDVTYLGTPQYLAPDIAGRFKHNNLDALSSFDIYKKADCYSFGLLVWEVMRNGQSYIDPATRKPGESVESFLERILVSGEDVLCGLALEYCDTTEEMVKHTVIGSAIKTTLAMCLKDNPSERAMLEDVVQTLARGTR